MASSYCRLCAREKIEARGAKFKKQTGLFLARAWRVTNGQLLPMFSVNFTKTEQILSDFNVLQLTK